MSEKFQDFLAFGVLSRDRCRREQRPERFWRYLNHRARHNAATDNVDQNIGLKYFLNGALASNIVIDTSAAATDTIEYVATDNAGNTARSTRTVIVVAPATHEPAPAP